MRPAPADKCIQQDLSACRQVQLNCCVNGVRGVHYCVNGVHYCVNGVRDCVNGSDPGVTLEPSYS